MKPVLYKRAAILIAVLLPVLSLAGAYTVFFTEFFREKDLLQNPPSKRCGDCHVSIYRQWKTSRHAAAWTAKNFKKESDEYKKQKC
ncbi:MAG: multiheme c-type cytochrome, partial [Nitrospinota bacterium]